MLVLGAASQNILRRAAGRQKQRYRADVRQRLTKGVDPSLRERLADGFALGAEEFREKIRLAGKGGREIAGSVKLRPRVSCEEVIALIERLRGEESKDFMKRRGDWARPLLLWTLRHYSGMTLKEVGDAVGGMNYTAVAMAIRRFERKSEKEKSIATRIRKLKAECEK